MSEISALISPSDRREGPIRQRKGNLLHTVRLPADGGRGLINGEKLLAFPLLALPPWGSL